LEISSFIMKMRIIKGPIYNKCSKCGGNIKTRRTKDSFLSKLLEDSTDALCNVCNPASSWVRIENIVYEKLNSKSYRLIDKLSQEFNLDSYSKNYIKESIGKVLNNNKLIGIRSSDIIIAMYFLLLRRLKKEAGFNYVDFIKIVNFARERETSVRINRKRLFRICSLLNDKGIINEITFVNSFEKLEIFKTEFVNKLNISEHVLENTKILMQSLKEERQGKNTSVVLGSCLYYICKKMGYKVKQAEIANILGITEVSIKNFFNTIKNKELKYSYQQNTLNKNQITTSRTRNIYENKVNKHIDLYEKVKSDKNEKIQLWDKTRKKINQGYNLTWVEYGIKAANKCYTCKNYIKTEQKNKDIIKILCSNPCHYYNINN